MDLRKVLMMLRYMQKKKYFKNFTEPNVKFVLSLHYNSNDSYSFVNGRQELKFKWQNCAFLMLLRE